VSYATTANSVAVANISGIGNIATVNLDGNASNILYGNGVFAGPSGAVANANYSNFAGTAYSVSGANVTGTVANATFATSAGSATTAGSANSVAGANVTGTVANATFATTAGTANSVAGANVTGTVDNATFATTAGSATTAGTVTTAAQPNITSVGTLTSLSVSGNVTGANVIATNYHVRSVDAAVSAAGSTQGTATILAKEFNRVSTVASGSGVVLPSAVAGMAIIITNTSANSLLVYPNTSAIINSLAANASYSQPAGARLDFISTTTTQWYTLNATYG
jgi:hypothetical protein